MRGGETDNKRSWDKIRVIHKFYALLLTHTHTRTRGCSRSEDSSVLLSFRIHFVALILLQCTVSMETAHCFKETEYLFLECGIMALLSAESVFAVLPLPPILTCCLCLLPLKLHELSVLGSIQTSVQLWARRAAAVLSSCPSFGVETAFREQFWLSVLQPPPEEWIFISSSIWYTSTCPQFRT